jgi:TPR repeat protein
MALSTRLTCRPSQWCHPGRLLCGAFLFGMTFAALLGAQGQANSEQPHSEELNRQESAEVLRLRELVRKGDAAAEFQLGQSYESGDGVPTDAVKAFELFQKSATQGNTDAETSLGNCYVEGKGIAKDTAKALFWFSKAAKAGDAIAQYDLGDIYYHAKGVAEDDALAAAWYQKAADQSDGDAIFYLALMYDKGDGVPKDHAKAIALYEQAAGESPMANGSNAHNPRAEFNLAIDYQDGNGVRKDLIEAYRLVADAASQGLPNAQFAIAEMYDLGSGIGPNHEEAMGWYRAAAKQGFPLAKTVLEAEAGDLKAQQNMAVAYEHGTDVTEDKGWAKIWACKAAQRRPLPSSVEVDETCDANHRQSTPESPSPIAKAAAHPPGTPLPEKSANPYVGLYTHEHVDSLEQIEIFPDHTFCFGALAGSLDLTIAGRWTETSQGLKMTEVKKQASDGVVVFWSPLLSLTATNPGELRFQFDGETLGDIGSFVFGTSATDDDALPAAIQPLFSDKANELSDIYTEYRDMAQVKSFVIAYRLHPEMGQKESPTYRVDQFHLPQPTLPPGKYLAGFRLSITYNKEVTRPPIDLMVHLEEDQLSTNGVPFGEKQSLPSSVTLPAPCTQSMLHAESKAPEEPRRDGRTRLEPFRSFNKDLTVPETAKPLFRTPYDMPGHH